MLLDHPGEIVTRQDLRDRLWCGQTFVDFDHGLNKAINRLREALSDSAANPRFVETISRRGYRLIVPVTREDLSHGASNRPRLAVLPFESVPPDSVQEFFTDGLTEEMISELGRSNPSRLGVIARTSVMQYKRTKRRVDEIGKELDVDYILEGSVRRSETRARITVQLIQVQDQTHLWAESYNRELVDILQVQHEVAQRVAASLALELLPQKSTGRKLVSSEAYECYLLGRYFWNKETDRDARIAIEHFEKALEHDPQYALALSGIADCYLRLGLYFCLPSMQAGAKAKHAAAQALAIDPHLAEAHTSMGSVHFWFDWNWNGAEEDFRRAIELNPNYAAGHFRYAAYLNAMQRFAEAGEEQRMAEELDPLSLIITMSAADAYYYSRQYSSAIDHLLRVLKREPNFPPAHANLGRAYAQSGMYEEAISAFETAARLSGVPQAEIAVAYAYARAGKAEKAETILKRMDELSITHHVPPAYMAPAYLALDNVPRALELLEQGFREKSYLMIFLNADPVYDPLRAHPGFVDLLARMNFPRHYE